MRFSKWFTLLLALFAIQSSPAMAQYAEEDEFFYAMQGDFNSLDDLRVWRVQLRIRTADRPKAGTDSKVYVKMTSGNQRFYLSRGGDDRKRNRWEVYDVVLADTGSGASLIETVGDITQLTLGINGKDIWKFDRIEVLINNPYDRDVTNEGESPYTVYRYNAFQEIANRDGYDAEFSLPGATLRSHSRWALNDKLLNFPWVTTLGRDNLGFQREVLEEILEAAIGNELSPGGELSKARWGRKRGRSHVGLKHKKSFPDEVARLDVDIHPSRLVDVELKFRLGCDGNRISAEIIKTKAKTSLLGKVFATTAFGSIQFGLNRLFDNTGRNFLIDSGACIAPRFSDDHHLIFVGWRG
ncbi:MAG: hypothetical protein AAF251_13475 [Pseudomonadota bacterium]